MNDLNKPTRLTTCEPYGRSFITCDSPLIFTNILIIIMIIPENLHCAVKIIVILNMQMLQ